MMMSESTLSEPRRQRQRRRRRHATSAETRAWWQRGLLELIELAVLVIVTPLLMFPEFSRVLSAIGVLALLFMWGASAAARRALNWPTAPFNSALLLVVLGVVIGIAVSTSIGLTWPKASGILLGLAWLRWLLLAAKTERDLIFWLGCFILLSLAMTGVGIVSSNWPAKIPLITPLVELLPQSTLALPGGAEGGISTNQLAGTMLIFTPLLASLLLSPAIVRRAYGLIGLVLAALLVLLGILLIATQSRLGWLGALAGVGSLLVLRMVQPETKYQRLIALVLLILSAAAGAAVIMMLDLARLQALWQELPRETLVGSFSSVEFRREVWQWALVAANDFLLTGTGLGTFREVVFTMYPITIPASYDIAHAHNIFLQVLLDIGVLGLIGYLAVLLVTVWLCWQIGAASVRWRPVAHGLLGGLIAFHVFGLADAVALGAKSGLLFWWLLALVAALYKALPNLTADAAKQQAAEVDADPSSSGVA